MFKKASMKIMPLAPKSTTTSNSNQDVRPIQTLLSAEKAVLLSLQKLSVDYAKAAEALRSWGLSEDNDLGGILTASTSLFNHFSLSLSQYVTHGHTMQRQLEVMAKKGESLDNLKQRRNSAHQKAEDTAHQLNKMNPDNKYYSMHADALRRLRKDVRKMEEDIRLEETILIDHKQTATKVWMRLKFGGLYECCEKGAIAGKYGKLVTAVFEGVEDINQPGMPRNPQLQSKIESLIMDADRSVNAVGLSVAGSRNSDRIIQESSYVPSAGSYTSPQTAHEQSPPPHPPPKPQNFPGGNGHFPERQGSSFPASSGRPYAPPSNQQQLSQGAVNSRVNEGSVDDFGANGANSGRGQSSGRPYALSNQQQLSQGAVNSRVNEGSVDDFGANGANSGRGQFPTPAVNTRPTGLSESGGQYGSSESSGHSLREPVVGGRLRDTSFSESINAGPSRLQDPPPQPTSHWQQQQPATSHYQNPYQYPVQMRPPMPSEYPPQDPPSQGGRQHEPSYSAGHKSSYSADHKSYSADHKSSYSAGPSHWQNQPVIMRPPESGYPPTQGGSHLNGDSSYSAGPSHLQSSPVVMRPPVSSESAYPPSQGGSHLNGHSSYSAGPSHLQSPPSDRFTTPPGPPPPPESGRYPSQDPPPLGGRHPSDSSSGGYPSHDPPTSHWQNHPSDRFPPPPPPALPPTLSGRHGNPPLHLQGPINTGSSESGGYPSQEPPLNVRHRTGGSSFSESTTSHWTPPPPNRFSNDSESTNVTSDETIRRAREGSFINQTMNSWGGGNNPDDCPPAYALMGNPESLVSDTGPKKKW